VSSKWPLTFDGKEIGQFNTEKARGVFAARVLNVVRILSENPSLLSDSPHPKIPESNLTARNYAVWLLKNAKVWGVKRACDMVEAAMPSHPQYSDNVVPFPKRG
jgi:hypothetical protein